MSRYYKIEKYDLKDRLKKIWLIMELVILVLFVYVKIKKGNSILILSWQIIWFIMLLPVFKSKIIYYYDFLYQYIKNNQLSLLKTENQRTYFEYFPEVKYKINDNKLYVRFRLDGSKYSEKIKVIEIQLGDYLKMPCVSCIQELGYVTYVYEMKQSEQIKINDFRDLQIKKDKICFNEDIEVNYLETPNFLCTGITGSGKTTAIQVIAYQLVANGTRVIYCDPKADGEMREFCKNYHIKYISDVDETFQEMKDLVREMIARTKDLESIGYAEYDFVPQYLIFDELLAYEKLSTKQQYEQLKRMISSVVVQGRKKRCFIGIALQRADASYIDTVIRENICMKIIMGHQVTPTAFEMVFGKDVPRIENYRQEQGTGLIMTNTDTRVKVLVLPYIKMK